MARRAKREEDVRCSSHTLSSRPERPLGLSAAASAAGGRVVEGYAVGNPVRILRRPQKPGVPEGTRTVFPRQPRIALRSILG